MWDLIFISEEDFTRHVASTIEQYGKKLKSIDLKSFNSNIVDPIKLTFDMMVYKSSWEEIIKNEISRQRDKANNNDIGYFHQKMFQYIKNCEVPKAGWDVIYRNPDGIETVDGEIVHTAYIEMKNKHNTMNAASSAKTYMKAQNQLLEDDDCVCCLVEAIAKHSQDIKWAAVVDGKRLQHKRIRRMSMDKFYQMVTGDEDAFYKICVVLPSVIENVIKNSEIVIPNDTVIPELLKIADEKRISMAMAVYLLGFGEYSGFKNIAK